MDARFAVVIGRRGYCKLEAVADSEGSEPVFVAIHGSSGALRHARARQWLSTTITA